MVRLLRYPAPEHSGKFHAAALGSGTISTGAADRCGTRDAENRALEARWRAFEGERSGFMRSSTSRSVKRPGRGLAVLLLALLTPAITGCPSEFTGQISTAFETAARGIATAAVDLLLNQVFPSSGTSATP